MKPLTLAEAAAFLRMSRSSLYQRKDLPRYRRPGSRVILFDQEELEAWLRQGRIGDHSGEKTIVAVPTPEQSSGTVIDIQTSRVYHRSTRYR